MKFVIYLKIFLTFQVFWSIIDSKRINDVDNRIQKYNLHACDYLEKVQKVFDMSYKEVSMTANNLRNNALRTEENILLALKNTFNDFDGQVNKLKQKRKGIIAHQCKSIIDDCKRDVFDVLINSSVCLTEKLDQAASYMDNMHFIHENMVSRSTKLKTNFQDCCSLENKGERFSCLEQVSKQQSQLNPKVLIAQINDMFGKIKKTEMEIDECYNKKSIDLIKERIPLLIYNMKECINKS